MSHRSPPQSELDGVHVGDGAPHLGDQTLLGDVDVAQVEGVVDGLHLPHLDEPHSDRLGGGLQDPLPVILGLVQHLLGGGGRGDTRAEVDELCSGWKCCLTNPIFKSNDQVFFIRLSQGK